MVGLITWMGRPMGVALAGLVLAGAPHGGFAQSTSGCRTADTVVVPQRLVYFQDLLTATAPNRVAVRDSLGLSPTTASKVSLVTKSATCASAVTALNSQRGEAGTIRSVWVYKLGSDYGVEDPALPVGPGEYTPIYIFSSRFEYKRTLAGL
jgi:hypothetical protein